MEQDSDVLDFVLKHWDKREEIYGNLHRRWLETIACYNGFYYHTLDSQTRRFEELPEIPPWRKRLAINLLLPRIRSQVAKFLRNRPIFDVIPATADTIDIDMADVEKKILRSQWYQNNYNYKFIDLLLWLALTGNAYLYIYWDPFTGPLKELKLEDFLNVQRLEQISSEEELVIELASAAERFQKFVKKNESNKIFLGNCEWESRSPFDFLYPNYADFQKLPWLITSQTRSKEEYEALGIDTKDFTKPNPNDLKYILFRKRIDALRYFDTSVSLGINITDLDTDDYLELHYWRPRSQKYKDGFHAVIAGGKLLQKGPNPYNHGLIPIVHFSADKTPSKIIATCAGEQTVNQIREYQATRNKIVETQTLMANQKWLVPHTAHITQESITSEPGEIIKYKGALAPAAVPPPPLPRYLFDMQGLDLRDIDEIFAQRDATKGVNPPGVRSATQVAALQEADDSQLAIIGLNLDTGFSIAGRLTIATIAQFVSEDRLYAYVGEKSRYEAVELKQGFFDKQKPIAGADYFNVRVTQFSQFGLSRAGQMEILKSLLQYKVFAGPQDREKIMKWLSMGYFEDEIDEYKIDRSNARRENNTMATGQQIVPLYTDHHKTHKEEHVLYTKTSQFRNLPPQIQALFMQHIKDTELFELLDIARPQVLMIKAKIIAAKQEGLPPQLLFGASNGR